MASASTTTTTAAVSRAVPLTSAQRTAAQWIDEQKISEAMGDLNASFVLLRLPPGLKQLCYHFVSVLDGVALGRTSRALRKIIIGNPEMKLSGVYRARDSEAIEALAHFGVVSLIMTYPRQPLACSSEVERCIALAAVSGALRSLSIHEASSWLIEQLYSLTSYRTSTMNKRQLAAMPALLSLHISTLTDTSGSFLSSLPVGMRSLTIDTYDWLRVNQTTLRAALTRLVNITSFSTTIAANASLPFGYLEIIVTSLPRLITLQVGGPSWNTNVFTNGLVTTLPNITRLIVQDQSAHCTTIARVMPSLSSIYMDITNTGLPSLSPLTTLSSLECIQLRITRDVPAGEVMAYSQWHLRRESYLTHLSGISDVLRDLHLYH